MHFKWVQAVDGMRASSPDHLDSSSTSGDLDDGVNLDDNKRIQLPPVVVYCQRQLKHLRTDHEIRINLRRFGSAIGRRGLLSS